MHRILPIAATALLVGGVAAVMGYQASSLEGFSRTEDPALVITAVAAWVLFAAAFLLLLRVRGRRAVLALVIGGSVLIGGAALLGPPNTSTDSARYAWDGIVSNAGVSPYDHVPASDELAALRPTWLFSTTTADANGYPVCHAPRTEGAASVPSGEPLCTAINRPLVPTIYPPLAELYFAGVRFVVDPAVPYWPFQVTGLVISLSVTALLLVHLLRRGKDVRWVALWAWSPFVATEAVTNSHVDVLGVLLALAASLLVASGRRVWGGIALGAAIATKLVPVIVAPPLLRRRPLTVVLVAVGTFALLYVPYVLASGFEVIGYLPGYLSEEGFDDGSRFALLSFVLPGPVALVVSVLVVAVVAALCWWKADPEAPWTAQVVLVGTILLVLSPHYAWYALLLIPFIVLSRRWEWLAVPFALTLGLLINGIEVVRISLAAALLIVLIGWWLRSRPAAAQRGQFGFGELRGLSPRRSPRR